MIEIPKISNLFHLSNNELSIKQNEMNRLTRNNTRIMWEEKEEEEVVYSLEERKIGRWIDGKPLYEKTIDFGNLPGNGEKTVYHNIKGLDTFFISNGFVKTLGGGTLSLETHTFNPSGSVRFTVTATRLICYSDIAATKDYTAILTIIYTKLIDSVED